MRGWSRSCYVDVQLYAGRSLDIVTQAETIGGYGTAIATDYARYTAGTAMLETAERLTETEREPAVQQYLLLVGGLRTLAAAEREPGLVLDAFLLRSLAVAGWAASFTDCARCGAPGPHRAFAVAGRRRGLRVLPTARLRRAAPGDVRPARGAAGRRLEVADASQPRRRGGGQRAGGGVPAVAPGTPGPLAAAGGALVTRRRPGPNGSGVTPSPNRCRRRRRTPPVPGRRSCRPGPVPRHVAIVMDGNGRWANARGLPRTAGHAAGEAALLDVVAGAIEVGVTHVSAYAFSTENWRRSPDEVRFLMGFNRDVIRRRRDQMHAWGVRVRWAGRRPRLWRSVIAELERAEQLTRHNDVLTLTMCVNYGGRAEIADAARAIAREAAAGRLDPDRVDERTVGPVPRRAGAARRRSVPAHVRRAAHVELHALAVRLRRAGVPGRALAGRRPAGAVAGGSSSTPTGDRRHGGAVDAVSR